MGSMKEPAAATLYGADYHAWVVDQVQALQQRDFGRLDLQNLIDEVASLGRSEQRELEHRLAVLLVHLLKYQHQWLLRSRSWTFTIEEQRRALDDLLDESPSLRPSVGLRMAKAYRLARLAAERETGISLKEFPDECPYAAEQVLDPHWLPPT